MNELINILNVNLVDEINQPINNVLINITDFILDELRNDLSFNLKKLKDKIRDKIHSFIIKLKPKNLVYLAFDGCLSKQDLINKKQKYISSIENRENYIHLIELLYNSDLNQWLIDDLKTIFDESCRFKLIISGDTIPSSANQKIINYIKRNYNNSQINVVFNVEFYYLFVLDKIVFIHLDNNSFLSLNELQCNLTKYFSSKLQMLDISKKHLLMDFLYILIITNKLPLATELNELNLKIILSAYHDYLLKYCEHIISAQKIFAKIEFTINYKNLCKYLIIVKNKLKSKSKDKCKSNISGDLLCEVEKHQRFPQHKNYNYIKSVLWYFKTYINYQPSNNWAYMYYINPSLADIIEYIYKQDYELYNINYYSTNQLNENNQITYLRTFDLRGCFRLNGMYIIPFQ